MSLSIDIKELDLENTKKLLNRLDEWRSGICPDGKLAKEACFVLEHRPTITIHPDQLQQIVTTEIITEREWSENLIDCGVMTHLNDDILMKTLSDFFMIFHSLDEPNSCNTLHSIHLLKHASFKVDNILRPTRLLQHKLKDLFMDDDENNISKWQKLVNIWNTFGYLWPRKIILGYKTHLKQSYKFKNSQENMNGYYYTLNKLKEKFHRQITATKNDELFNLIHFLENSNIIARVDLAPIHEFFDLDSRNKINQLIHSKFIQIPINCPIKFYNVMTNSYLCWDPYTNSRHDPSFDGDDPNYLVCAISADPLELSRSPESQYVWRMTWRPTHAMNTNDTFDPEDHRPQTIRGCSKVYIYPACKSVSPSNNTKRPAKLVYSQSWAIQDRHVEDSGLIDTHQMVLSCRPYHYEMKNFTAEFSKLRPLRLLSSNSNQYKNEKIDWTIEYPNNKLKYMTDAQANIKLNFHEHLRRLKPLLVGDIIQLQQIGLLTAFNPVCKLTGGLQQTNTSQSKQPQPVSSQSLLTSRLTIARKPSIKSKNKKSVLCVDEDVTSDSWKQNTFWKIELATKADMNRHSNQFIRWPQSNMDQIYGYPKDYHPLLSKGQYNIF